MRKRLIRERTACYQDKITFREYPVAGAVGIVPFTRFAFERIDCSRLLPQTARAVHMPDDPYRQSVQVDPFGAVAVHRGPGVKRIDPLRRVQESISCSEPQRCFFQIPALHGLRRFFNRQPLNG